MPKIIHYRNDCIGCNSCVECDASIWKIDEKDGKSSLLGATQKKDVFVLNISKWDLEKNKKAAADCPVKIIKVIE